MDSDYYSQSQNTGQLVPSTDQTGIILKLAMKNFMCHDNLEVNFNPRINFICGKNGSGKSAIQTAIAVGLGGKALSTNRGSSMKALIKNDKNSSSITIIMSNQGPLAYKPHEYGHSIQVERSFSHSSTSYKIRNASGKLVSTEKKELDKIVAQFNIQTDNPVCILHQDVARNFLNSSDPKTKFKFYLKASRFDEITKLYTESTLRVSAIKDTLSVKFEVVIEAFHDVIEMKNKLKIMEDAKEKEMERENLENELVWAKINESNKQLNEIQKKKEHEVLAKRNTEKKLENVEESTMKEKLRELENRIVEMDEMVKDARAKLKPARDELTRKNEQLSIHSRELTDIKQSVKLTKRKHATCLAEIDNLTKNAPEMKLKQDQMKKDIVAYKKSLESIQAAENSFEHDKSQLQDTIDNLSANLQSVNSRCNDLKRQKNKREEQITQLTKNKSSVSVYGNVMVMIVEEVNRANLKFEKKPIGPIGMHIKVRDSVWGGAVENFIGKTMLSSFCVDNTKDKNTLSNIMRNVCSRYNATPPPIICSKFFARVHNIQSNEARTQEYSNLIRALEIDSPVVANCLIDQMEAETVLLIPTNQEAYGLLDKQSKVPANCKRAFTQNGTLFYAAPNYKSYSSFKPVTHATLLQAEQEQLIRELKNEIVKLSQEITVVEEEVRNYQQQLKVTTSSLKNNEMELKHLRQQRYSIGHKINDLKASVESESQTNVGYFVEESKTLKELLDKETEKFQTLKGEWDKMREETEEAKRIYEGLQNTIAESDREKAPIQVEIQRLKTSIQQASTKTDLMKQRVKEHNNKLEQLETEIQELTEELNGATENASQICDPINTQRSAKEINKELQRVVQYLKNLEQESGGTLVELQRDLKEREEDFNSVKEDLDGLRKLVMKLQKALKHRKSQEAILQQIQANSAKHNFQMFLNERNFDGKLEFDMEAGTLEIKVKPQNEVDPKAKRLDTASLSGGEKSFSTVCFIMALWQEVQLPFHFLDEFDVFMDGINRRIVMDLLMSYAKRVKQQFVFLTPLDTSSVPVSNIVSLHRLEAPRT